MSVKIQLDKLSQEYKTRISGDLELKIQAKRFQPRSKFPAKTETVEAYYINDRDEICIPYHYAINTLDLKSSPYSEYRKIECKFTKPLRALQAEVKPQIISQLNTAGSCVLSFYPGFGKTSISIFVATKIRLQTLIIVHRLVLVEQWKESITKFCDSATICVVESKRKHKPEYIEQCQMADFLIVNAQNVEKMPSEIFKNAGTLIVDEIHTIATETLSRSLYHIYPRYLIGLSATPTRPDGKDVILDVYFGKHRLIRKLYCPHTVYKVETGIKPEVKKNSQGTIDWSGVIDYLSNHDERNELIVDITQKHKDRYFLVLCKRISQIRYLESRLKEMGENVSVMVSGDNSFDRESRIILSTIQKCGVGFSHDVLNTLILAIDVEEYFVQYLGRIMRTEEVKPVVFDLVDDHPSLKRHFSSRKHVYLESGGKIKKME